MESSQQSIGLQLGLKFYDQVAPVLLKATQKVQEKSNNSQGAFLLEIITEAAQELKELEEQGVPGLSTLTVFGLLIEHDHLLISPAGNEYSLVLLPGYRKLSEVFAETMPGLLWNFETKAMDVGTAPTLNFKKTLQLFLSKDPSELVVEKKEFETKVSQHKELFLDGEENSRVILTSHLKSGNTMFRKLLEQTSGIVTGTTHQGIIAHQLQLSALGFKGEGISDSRVFCVKTHYPYPVPIVLPASGSVALVLVRNPLDGIVSYWYQAVTQSHDKKIGNDFTKEFPNEWEYLIRFYCKIWCEFHQYYIDIGREKKVPVYFLRYEDVVKDKEKYLSEAYSFMLGVEDIKGTYLEQRIKQITSEEKAGLVYERKAGGTSKNISLYSEAQLNEIKTICKDLIHFFGYSTIDNIDNQQGTFRYEQVSQEDRKNHLKYLELNQQMKNWYLTSKEDLPMNPFQVDVPGTGIKLEVKDNPLVTMAPIRNKCFIPRS